MLIATTDCNCPPIPNFVTSLLPAHFTAHFLLIHSNDYFNTTVFFVDGCSLTALVSAIPPPQAYVLD